MTVQEIKEKFTMPDVMIRYGVTIKNNMCSCPFHKDQHPSMRVYKDGAHCFSCGWNGDIFTFIQDMDHCDFKTAFRSLGGTYERNENPKKRDSAMVRRQIAQERNKQKERKERADFKAYIWGIRICREVIKQYEPFSDQWCECVNLLPMLEYAYDEKFLNDNKEVQDFELLRKCRTLRQKFYPR